MPDESKCMAQTMEALKYRILLRELEKGLRETCRERYPRTKFPFRKGAGAQE